LTPASLVRRNLLLAFLGATVALPGCSSRPTFDIPSYPGSMQSSGTPNRETEQGTLFRVRRETGDGVRTVAQFYRDELVAKRGWRESSTVGPTFLDGNLKVDRPGMGAGIATPVDPTKSGGLVVVYELDNKTYVEMWQHVPKQ
jgi:hypothetical protein